MSKELEMLEELIDDCSARDPDLGDDLRAILRRLEAAERVCEAYKRADDECNAQPESVFEIGGQTDMECHDALRAYRALDAKETQ